MWNYLWLKLTVGISTKLSMTYVKNDRSNTMKNECNALKMAVILLKSEPSNESTISKILAKFIPVFAFL